MYQNWDVIANNVPGRVSRRVHRVGVRRKLGLRERRLLVLKRLYVSVKPTSVTRMVRPSGMRGIQNNKRLFFKGSRFRAL